MRVYIEPRQRDGTMRVFTSVSTGALQPICDEHGRPIDIARPEERQAFGNSIEVANRHFMNGMQIFAYLDAPEYAA